MKSRVLLITILIVLLSSIFFFSSQNGTDSTITSDSFTSSLINMISNVTKYEISNTRKERIIKKTEYIVRKAAHFSLYFLIGVDIFLLLSSYKIKKSFIISIIICFILACSDEFHQLFSAGRAAQFSDVLLDTIGSLIGIIITNFITKRLKHHTQ